MAQTLSKFKLVKDHAYETTDLLPPWSYQNEELLQLEIEQLFKPNWMMVGHVSDIPDRGDYLTFDGLNERALVVNSGNGIKAFHNICRHRGSKILYDTGNCPRALICPFHGWRYDFSGNLQFIPGEDGFPNIDKSRYSLVALDMEIWQGFIFVTFQPGSTPISKSLQGIDSLIRAYRLEELKPYSKSMQYEYPINWKVFHDIDNEGYHVPFGHPSLHQLYGQNYIDSTIGQIAVSHGWFNKSTGKLWSVRHYRSLLPEFSHLSEKQHNLWLYCGVFPNLGLAFYPDMMETYMSVPIDLKRTKIISRTYALPDSRRAVQAVRYLNHRINRVTEFEDREYMITIQEGLKSSVFPKWTLSRRAETGIGDYHRIIQDYLPVTTLANQPASGSVRKINEQMSQGADQLNP